MYLNRIPDIKKAKSLFEALVLDVCRLDGIENPEVNSPIDGHEVDCVWRERRLAVELDGYEFHRGLEKFEADVARNNRLVAEGWDLLLFTWRRVAREPDQVASELRKALARSGAAATMG
jgi:very-short-patch-repair endonuclease